MKAKIRKTGETIEVTRNKCGAYVDENCVGYNLKDLVFEHEEDDRWRYITERAAIAAMQGLLANSALVHGDIDCSEKVFIIARAMRYADELVEKLKENRP